MTLASLTSHLEALRLRLDLAGLATRRATTALVDGNRNLAMGTVLDLEYLLPECDALYRTIMLLHRSRVGEGEQ